MDQRMHLRGVASMFTGLWWSACPASAPKVVEGTRPRPRPRTCGPGTRLKPTRMVPRALTTATSSAPPSGLLGALASRALVGGMPEREATHTLERLRTLMEG